GCALELEPKSRCPSRRRAQRVGGLGVARGPPSRCTLRGDRAAGWSSQGARPRAARYGGVAGRGGRREAPAVARRATAGWSGGRGGRGGRGRGAWCALRGTAGRRGGLVVARGPRSRCALRRDRAVGWSSQGARLRAARYGGIERRAGRRKGPAFALRATAGSSG